MKNSFAIAEQSVGWAKAGEWVFSEHLICSQPHAKFWEGMPSSKDPAFFFFPRKTFNLGCKYDLFLWKD